MNEFRAFERFTITAISRQDIAILLNTEIKTSDLLIKSFEADDNRLTNAVCGEVATVILNYSEDDPRMGERFLQIADKASR